MGIFAMFAFVLAMFSCGGTANEDTENSSVIAKDEDGKPKEERLVTNVVTDKVIDFDPEKCEKETVDDWTNFIGIPYGANELALDSILGKSNGGQYSDDSSAFVYNYKEVERVPFSVWCNGRTGLIETIFLEVTSFVQYFESDVEAVSEQYNLRECDTKWLGMKPKEVKKILGDPTKEETLEDEEGLEIISLEYDSEDLRSIVSFRFYESQDFYCSLIMVNWFY